MDIENKVRTYGVEMGLENFTIEELISSHKRQRQLIDEYNSQIKAANELKAKVKDYFKL